MTERFEYYRALPGSRYWPSVTPEDIEAIPPEFECVRFIREKKSHKGIKKNKHLKKLCAGGVNQPFLEEICELDNLDYLHLQEVTADDLSPLAKLPKLVNLDIVSVRKANDFSFYLQMPALKFLFIEHAKHLTSLDPFVYADSLISLGVQGSMWTRKKLPTLKPISKLKNLEALFLASIQLKDKDLSCLAEIPNLRLLECARFAPKRSFLMLRELMPDLECNWCDQYEIN